jgi:hypothetical protein
VDRLFGLGAYTLDGLGIARQQPPSGLQRRDTQGWLRALALLPSGNPVAEPGLVHVLQGGELAVELGQVGRELPQPLRRAHRLLVALDLVGECRDRARQVLPARGHRRARAVGR